jgi:hypothetical protein
VGVLRSAASTLTPALSHPRERVHKRAGTRRAGEGARQGGTGPLESLPRLRGRRGGGLAERRLGPHAGPLPRAGEGAQKGGGKPRPFYEASRCQGWGMRLG